MSRKLASKCRQVTFRFSFKADFLLCKMTTDSILKCYLQMLALKNSIFTLKSCLNSYCSMRVFSHIGKMLILQKELTLLIQNPFEQFLVFLVLLKWIQLYNTAHWCILRNISLRCFSYSEANASEFKENTNKMLSVMLVSSVDTFTQWEGWRWLTSFNVYETLSNFLRKSLWSTSEWYWSKDIDQVKMIN